MTLSQSQERILPACPKCGITAPHTFCPPRPEGRLVKPPRVPLGTCVRCGRYPCECFAKENSKKPDIIRPNGDAMSNLSAHLQSLTVYSSFKPTDLLRKDLSQALLKLWLAECAKRQNAEPIIDEWGYEEIA